MSRTKNSIRNVSFTLIGSIITLLLQLINRKVFVNYLSSEYLGLNGLFSNILSMLSLSEMGVGTAMVFALYKPIAENDKEKCKSLMALYKKYYTIIGCFVLIAGALLAPFLQIFIKEMPDIPWIRLYFLMFVLDSGMSYFYSYKRSYLLCNQENYISSITTLVASSATKIIQLLILIITHNYFLFLLVQIIFTRLENVFISKIAEKKYPFLLEKDIVQLDANTTKEIRKNSFAMLAHKVGNVVVNFTDNLIISKILGLEVLGIYSNYNLLFSNVNSVISKAFSSVTSSIGNLAVEKEKTEAESVFFKMLFINFCVFSICSSAFWSLTQPFVLLWLGEKYLMSDFTVIILTSVFYITGMRLTALGFRDATGVFYNDRFKPLIEATVNLVASIPLTYKFGVAGVKLGTFISTLFVSFWIEGYVIYKYYFEKRMSVYFIKQFFYALFTVGVCWLSGFCCKKIDNGTILTFVIECFLSLIIPVCFIVIFFIKTQEFTYLKDKIWFLLFKRKKKNTV